VGFEAIDAFGRPAMFKRPVKFHRCRLQLHPGFETVGRVGAAAGKAINLFLQVDERFFHVAATIGSVAAQSKQAMPWEPVS